MAAPSHAHAGKIADRALINEFKRFVEAERFPCVGAKAALHRDQITFLVEEDLTTGPRRSTVSAIQAFSKRYCSDAPLFQSLVLLFRQAFASTERVFEERLWGYLQRMHDIDAEQHAWDPSVSNDPSEPDFSFSIGGRGYYVVGLHANASRSARRFARPALVFNLHDQFERLRAEGRYEPIRNAITSRDKKTEGTQNPMLKKFGTSSEARQYSGRAVDDQWWCPFHAR